MVGEWTSKEVHSRHHKLLDVEVGNADFDYAAGWISKEIHSTSENVKPGSNPGLFAFGDKEKGIRISEIRISGISDPGSGFRNQNFRDQESRSYC